MTVQASTPRKPTNATRNRIARAVALMATGNTIDQAARIMGERPCKFDYVKRTYGELWQTSLARAQTDYEATGRIVIENLEETDSPLELQPKIRNATAMIAAGASHGEIIDALGLAENTLKHWQRRYPEFWKAELDRAMHAALIVVRRQAGTDGVLDDPEAHIRRATACKRWAEKDGRELFPKREGQTVRTFYEGYYKPTRLGDAAPTTLLSYETVVSRWELLTGDPPLAEITVPMLATFKGCLQKMRGKKAVDRLSVNSIRGYFRHLQAIIDKAGPAGHRNRDAAGIIPQAPWIKPPRAEISPPRIVSAEHVGWCYQAAIAMDRPRLQNVKPAAWWRALLAVAWNTGLRRRTLFEMALDMIDWQQARLVLPAARMKSGRFEIIPLNDVALEHLRMIRGPRPLVFEWTCELRTFHRDFHRLQDEAGISRKNHFGLHNIRKTVATMLWETSPGAAQLAMGHAPGVTQQHYVAGFGIVSRALDHLPQPAAFTAGRETGSPNGEA
ncbi:MAG TPA: tyrosine-type recombinase/integrase [Thermoguttaceae bacterium]|nr:tyrosine-type recombinase/integrase [Thermoguttaceae bacterium]